LGHSDANLTTNIYAEMASEAIRTELRKLPWITKNGVQIVGGDCAPISGSEVQTASFPDKMGEGGDSSKHVDFPLRRRVLAALDTLRQNAEMVDATGLEPVAEILEMLAR